MKNITVSDDVYERITSLKFEGDSYSDVIRRILNGKRVRVSSFFGVLRGSEFLDELEKDVVENRKKAKNREF